MHEGHPFPRGLLALRSEAGLLAFGPTGRAFPADSTSASGFLERPASPITVAGPRRIPTGFPSPPTSNERDRTAGGRGLSRRAAPVGWPERAQGPRPTPLRRRVRHGCRRIRPPPPDLSRRARRPRLRDRRPRARRPGARNRRGRGPTPPPPRGTGLGRDRGRTGREPDRARRAPRGGSGKRAVRQPPVRGRLAGRRIRHCLLRVGLPLDRPRRELRKVAQSLKPGGPLALIQYCGVRDERTAADDEALMAALARAAPEIAA